MKTSELNRNHRRHRQLQEVGTRHSSFVGCCITHESIKQAAYKGGRWQRGNTECSETTLTCGPAAASCAATSGLRCQEHLHCERNAMDESTHNKHAASGWSEAMDDAMKCSSLLHGLNDRGVLSAQSLTNQDCTQRAHRTICVVTSDLDASTFCLHPDFCHNSGTRARISDNDAI